MKIFISFFLFLLITLSSCQMNQPRDLTAEETAEYINKGKSIIQQSFKALSGQLGSALNEGGVQNAVSYCNIKANPIMDSLSQAHQVTISRVSLRPRNPGNITGAKDAEIMKDYLKLQSEQEPMEPFLETTQDDGVTFYMPITIISPLCLKCHGEVGKDIAQEDYDVIKSLYPQDQATGYVMNELRGMWKVEFE
jgi:hypothetical protein